MTKRIVSFFLTLVFVIGTAVSVLPVSAGAAYKDRVDNDGKPLINYYSKAYNEDREKLNDMTLYKSQNGYRIYVEEYTGEIAFEDIETGDVVFSNPYDIGVSGNVNSDLTKDVLLSQIVLDYTDTSGNNKTLYSYTDAAVLGQIGIKNIKNGIRMEYAIGEIQTKRLVPVWIPKDRLEKKILEHITNDFYFERVKSFYKLYDPSDPKLTETESKEIEAKFPITKRMAIYVLQTKSQTEKKQIENIIKTYCARYYTMDDLEQDHADTDYHESDDAPPCFRMALEYKIEEDGLSVRLPANGIRFDESKYTLGTIAVLPYMGAGNINYDGYTFIPDGSGALIDYSTLRGYGSALTAPVYGVDFAYSTVNAKQEQPVRFPVFGSVIDAQYDHSETGAQVERKCGFVAIITEGDSLAQIVTENNASLHKYSAVYARFTPRPSDTYVLVSTVGNKAKPFPVTSKRKYSGSYVIKYKLLSDPEKGSSRNYEASYVGMAKAYRDYLYKEGILERKTADSVGENVPIYIDTFGSIKAKSTFLSFPVQVDRELTTFEDVATMYDELSEAGVENIKFRLTGYSNGGLDSTYPAKVKWVSALGGKSGFEDLRDYAAEKGFGVYPDFDFAYVANTAYFDGFSEKTDAIRTIDGRYTSRKYYDSATQSLENDYAKAVSPSRYKDITESFFENYSEYGLNSLSASTLGTALNSDFDKNDPYNREDSKKQTSELLAALKESFGEVMVDGGNAYVLPYVTDIIGAPTDSSNYIISKRAVPFVGFVLHGSMNFCGDALNMEGDIKYSILKALENGSSLYFTLAYENIEELKESQTYNKYYSVSYSVWKDEIIEDYKMINDALKDLQTSLIEDHEYITDGLRIPTAAQLEQDEKDRAAKQEEYNRIAEEEAAKNELDRKLAERKGTTFIPLPGSGVPKTASDDTRTAPDGKTIYSVDPKYQIDQGTVVKETYEDGTVFLINYNSFDVIINYEGESVIIEALSFIKM
ncbi:MAG: hypothetical protein IJT70_07360 [Clostridia bacterium]|nr:hypothetical protein [Clostridia bacterium]